MKTLKNVQKYTKVTVKVLGYYNSMLSLRLHIKSKCKTSLAHRRNVARLSLFCGYYFGRCSSEMVPLPYSRERSTRYFDRMHDFSII